jgi:hypothetical protein
MLILHVHLAPAAMGGLGSKRFIDIMKLRDKKNEKRNEKRRNN